MKHILVFGDPIDALMKPYFKFKTDACEKIVITGYDDLIRDNLNNWADCNNDVEFKQWLSNKGYELDENGNHIEFRNPKGKWSWFNIDATTTIDDVDWDYSWLHNLDGAVYPDGSWQEKGSMKWYIDCIVGSWLDIVDRFDGDMPISFVTIQE